MFIPPPSTSLLPLYPHCGRCTLLHYGLVLLSNFVVLTGSPLGEIRSLLATVACRGARVSNTAQTFLTQLLKRDRTIVVHPALHTLCSCLLRGRSHSTLEYVTYNREQTKIQTCYENTIQDNDTTTSPIYNLAFVLSSPGTPSVTAAEARTTVLRSLTFVTINNRVR